MKAPHRPFNGGGKRIELPKISASFPIPKKWPKPREEVDIMQ